MRSKLPRFCKCQGWHICMCGGLCMCRTCCLAKHAGHIARCFVGLCAAAQDQVSKDGFVISLKPTAGGRAVRLFVGER